MGFPPSWIAFLEEIQMLSSSQVLVNNNLSSPVRLGRGVRPAERQEKACLPAPGAPTRPKSGNIRTGVIRSTGSQEMLLILSLSISYTSFLKMKLLAVKRNDAGTGRSQELDWPAGCRAVHLSHCFFILGAIRRQSQHPSSPSKEADRQAEF
jgi:hypothetical protein